MAYALCLFNFFVQKSARKEVCAAFNGYCMFIGNMQFIMFIILKIKAEAEANLFANSDSLVCNMINTDRMANPTCPLSQSSHLLNLIRSIQRQWQTKRVLHPVTLQFTVGKSQLN